MSIRQLEYQEHNIGPRAKRILPVEHTFDADLVTYRILTTPKEITAWIKAIPLGSVVAVDVETNALPQFRTEPKAGLNVFRAEMTLIQMGIGSREIVVFGPKLLDVGPARDAFNALMADTRRSKVFHNAKFDMKFLQRRYESVFENCDCTLVMRKLLTQGFLNVSASLAACCFDYLDYDMEKETREEFFRGEITEVADMSPKMLRYAALDVAATWEIYPILLKYLEIERMTDCYNFTERDLPAVVAEMELTGIGVDVEYLRDVIQPMLESKIHELQLDVDATLKWFKVMPKEQRKVRADELDYIAKGWTHVIDYKESLNVNATKDVQEALNGLGLDIADSKAATLELPTSTPESLRAGRLRSGRDITPQAHYAFCVQMCEKIGELRKSRKAVGSFVIPLQGRFTEEATGRVHCDLNQCGANTGRFTHSNPNLAQMPKPDEKGIFGTTPLRRAFTFPVGMKPIVFDYKSCELRILAEITQDPSLCVSVAKDDPHTDNAILMYPHIDPKEITKDSIYRLRAKSGIYLKCYGGGAARLAATLGIAIEDAAEILRLLAETFNFAEFEQKTKALAVQKGYAVTLSGRKRYFAKPDASVMSKWEYRKAVGSIERAALNHPIQGTNADITKLAMIWAHKALKPFGGKLVMSIHDELVAYAPEEFAEQAAAAMGEAMLEAERQFLTRVESGIDGGVKDDWSH